MDHKALKNTDSFDNRRNSKAKSTSRFAVPQEYRVMDYQLSKNEIDELRTSLYYVESRLEKELDVKNDLVQQAEADRRKVIDCERRLAEQMELNKLQAHKISTLSDQLDKFTGSQDNIVKHLKDKFDDYNKEMSDKEQKVNQLNRLLMQTQDKLENVTRDRDRYLKELEMADETIKTKDAQIKRLNTELRIAEKTIDEFITCKEKKITSFFDDETIYTDVKKIESILTNLDDTKRDYSQLGKVTDESQLHHCRPYIIQKMRQEELKRLEMEIATQKDPDLNVLPEEVRKIVKKNRDKFGNDLSPKQVDRMLLEINKAYHTIRQDKILKVKAQLGAEIEYLKRVLSLLIPLDKDKARTEIAYLRSELKNAREDIRRLNILTKKKRKGSDMYYSQQHAVSDDQLQDISTEDGYKSNSRFIEKALGLAENAVNETKSLNRKISENVKGFNSHKTKNYSTWREEDHNDDHLSEKWLISEINSALKGSNENMKRMVDNSRLNLN